MLVDPRLELSTRRVWLKDEAPLDTTDPRVTVAEDRVTIADLGKGDEGRLDQEIFSILYKQPPSPVQVRVPGVHGVRQDLLLGAADRAQ